MKKHAIVYLIGCLTLAISVFSFHSNSAAEPDDTPDKVHQQWEHLALDYSANLDKELSAKINSLGDKGWELVSVSTRTHNGTTQGVTYYFKRPKELHEQNN